MSSRTQIKYGAMISYVLLFANTLYGLFITPFVLRFINTDIYGVYKSVSSFCGTLAIVDLGLGSTMTRYLARYKATGEKDKANNFIAMVFVQFLAIMFLLAIAGTVLYFNINNVYAQTFTIEQIELARKIFLIILINMALRILENLFFGISNGNEHFVFSNSIKAVSLVLRVSLIVIILPQTNNVIVLVFAETIVSVLAIIVFCVYCYGKLKIRPKLVKWDNEVFKESFGYTLLIFIQTIVLQFSGNVDNILIGAYISASAVTVYSMALTIYNMYQNLSGAVADLMLPRMTKKSMRLSWRG